MPRQPTAKLVSAAKALPLLLSLFATTPVHSQPVEFRSPFEEELSRLGEVVAGIPDFTGDEKGDVALLFHADRRDRPEVHLFNGLTGEFMGRLVSPVENDGEFGGALTGLKDINGNGMGEVVVGARERTLENPPVIRDRVYIFDGSTGEILHTFFSENPDDLEGFGFALSTMPDVSGDGFEELVVGAISANVGIIEYAGAAYIFDPISGDSLLRLVSPNPSTGFGRSVAGIPDVSGDGLGDVIVGAPREPDSFTTEGRAYIFDGSSGEVLHSLISPNEQFSGLFGFSVAGVSDIDGDGSGDVVVGAPIERGEGVPFSAGRAYVFSGSNGDIIHSLVSPTQASGIRFGEVVETLGDFDGDRFPEIVVSEPGSSPGGSPERGVVNVFDGFSGELIDILESPIEGETTRFGSSISPVPDVNLDGCRDLVVGAQYEDHGNSPFRAGRSYLFISQCGLIRNPNSDINLDGKVNALDLEILLEDWGKVSGAG